MISQHGMTLSSTNELFPYALAVTEAKRLELLPCNLEEVSSIRADAIFSQDRKKMAYYCLARGKNLYNKGDCLCVCMSGIGGHTV